MQKHILISIVTLLFYTSIFIVIILKNHTADATWKGQENIPNLW